MHFLELLNQHNVCYQKHRQPYESFDDFTMTISDSFQKTYNSHKLKKVFDFLYTTYGERCYEVHPSYKEMATTEDLAAFADRSDEELYWLAFLCFSLKTGESLNSLIVRYRYQQRDKKNVFRTQTRQGKPDLWGEEQWQKFLLIGALCFSDANIVCKETIKWSNIQQWVALGHFQSSTFGGLMRQLNIDFEEKPPYEWLIEKMHYRQAGILRPHDVEEWFPLLVENNYDNSLIADLATCVKVLPHTTNTRQEMVKKIHTFYKEGDSTLISQFLKLSHNDQVELIKYIKPTLLLRSALYTVLSKNDVKAIQEIILTHYNINIVDWIHCYESGLIEQHPKISPANAILKFFGGKVGNVMGNEVDLHF